MSSTGAKACRCFNALLAGGVCSGQRCWSRRITGSFNALLAGGVCSSTTHPVPQADQFQCPLSGRGLQPLDDVLRLPGKVFQCPLSGRGLQRRKAQHGGLPLGFNALLAGGVCSLGGSGWPSSSSFQCPLSGRGLQPLALRQRPRAICFNALLAGGVCSFAGRLEIKYVRFQCPLSGRGLQPCGLAGLHGQD